jgi:hypothetical protein
MRAARAHCPTACVDDEPALAIVGQILARVLGDGHVHALAVELLGLGKIEQVFEHAPAALGREIGPSELEAVAAIVDPDAELPLDLPEVLVELPAHARKAAGVVGREHDGQRWLHFR